jgi:hypothetical protein
VEQKAGIDWAIAEAARSSSPYAGKIDPDRIAVAGLTGNPVGADEAWLQGLHAPAEFFCGGAEARALSRCSGDFDNAP